MATERERIIADTITRLSAILITGGFETDAGANVFVGSHLELGKDDPDEALLIVLGDDTVTKSTPKTYLNLPVEVQATVKVSATNPSVRIEAMLGDIKRAMELLDEKNQRALAGYPLERGTTRLVPREPGSLTAGVGVTYLIGYSEPWGDP